MEVKDKKEKKGQYWPACGRRKRAISRVRIYKGKGNILINDKEPNDYFNSSFSLKIFSEPLELTSKLKDFDITVICSGGGMESQAIATRLGIARALIKIDPALRTTMRKAGFLTRDPREKERKKPGLKGARRAPQWNKR